MKKKMLKVIPLILILALVAAGCATLVKNSAITLSASKNFYDLAMKVSADLYREGIIGDETKDEIIKVANIYYRAHNVAVDALITYNATKNAEDKEKLKIAILKAVEAWADVAALVNSIKPGALPEELGGGL